MARKLGYMDLRQIISLHLDGLSNRLVAKTLGLSRNTINEYLTLFKSCQIALKEIQTVSPTSMMTLCYPNGVRLELRGTFTNPTFLKPLITIFKSCSPLPETNPPKTKRSSNL